MNTNTYNVNSLLISDIEKIVLKKILDFKISKDTKLFQSFLKLFLTEEPNDINDILFDLLEDETVYSNFRDSMLGMPKDVKDSAISIYRNTHNDNFYKQVKKTKFSELDLLEIKKNLSKAIIAFPTKQIFILSIYRLIFNILSSKVKNHNTKSLLYSEYNVIITDEFEKLGINTFDLIFKHFGRFKYIPKDSSSNSLIMTCNLKNEHTNVIKKRNTMKPGSKFYLKIFSTSPGFDSSGLETEKKIYEELYKLVKYNVTPNILCKTITSSMTNFENFYDEVTDTMSPDEVDEIDEAIEEINENAGKAGDYKWSHYELLMTHPGGNGTTLNSAIKTLTPIELKYVMFQIMYTFYVFDKLEISHGDIHDGNIFVITLDKPRTFLYKIGKESDSRYYSFVTNKLVKIYDFDHSTICKSTELDLELPEKIKIKKTLNPDREDGEYFNKTLGETNIYNKNLDIMILYSWGLMKTHSNPDRFTIADSEFNDFSRDILRGFSGNSPYTLKTINQTYNELANPDNRVTIIPITREEQTKNLKELNRIMDKPLDEEFDLYGYEIDETYIYSKSWLLYLNNILSQKYGRIIKAKVSIDKNNQLWIPDEIVLDKLDILKHPYFDSILVTDILTINARNNTIFNIDDKL